MKKSHTHPYNSLKIHPYSIALGLLLVGLSTLFLGFTAAYIYVRVQNGFEAATLPQIFIFNSIFLIASSLCLYWANRAYHDDDTISYQYALTAALLLTLIFLAMQIFGWYQLGEIKAQPGKQYIKVLSIMHFGHVIGGIPFLGMFLLTAIQRMKEPVSVLVYFSDPEKRLKLRLLNVYWHFLDGLWLFLVLLFLISGVF